MKFTNLETLNFSLSRFVNFSGWDTKLHDN